MPDLSPAGWSRATQSTETQCTFQDRRLPSSVVGVTTGRRCCSSTPLCSGSKVGGGTRHVPARVLDHRSSRKSTLRFECRSVHPESEDVVVIRYRRTVLVPPLVCIGLGVFLTSVV